MTKPVAPKFLQIACSTSRTAHANQEKENLYALDNKGRVWGYAFPPASPVGWVLLPDELNEPAAEKPVPEKP